jgi:hypothetical protein
MGSRVDGRWPSQRWNVWIRGMAGHRITEKVLADDDVVRNLRLLSAQTMDLQVFAPNAIIS